MKTKKSTPEKREAVAVTATPDAPKSTSEEEVKLPCALKAFFQYCRIAWGYCLEHRVAMAVKAPRLTVLFIDAQLEKVDEVEELPTLKSRVAAASTARVVLESKNQAVLDLAQFLKGFIEYAYKNVALRDIQLRAAGLYNYGQAAGFSWATTSDLIREVKQYLTNNTATLIADGDMPTDFPTEFTTAADEFKTAWDDFIMKEKISVDGTGTQDRGLIELLEQLNPMLKQGKRTFKYVPLTRKLFTTTWLLDQVRGHHLSGVSGIVRLATTEQPKQGVRVSVQGDTENFVVTDEEGRYKFPIASGVYTLSFTSDDTAPFLVIDRKIKVGVMGRLSPYLVPVTVVSVSELSDDKPQEVDSGQELAAAVASISRKKNGVISH